MSLEAMQQGVYTPGERKVLMRILYVVLALFPIVFGMIYLGRQAAEAETPQLQTDMEAVFAEASREYNKTDNELARNSILQRRNSNLCSLLQSKGFTLTDFRGKVESVGASSTNLGILDVSIGSGIRFSTSSSSFGDMRTGTMIRPDPNGVYATVSTMKSGTPVFFSGELIPNPGTCVRDMGRPTRPDFTLRFTKITAR